MQDKSKNDGEFGRREGRGRNRGCDEEHGRHNGRGGHGGQGSCCGKNQPMQRFMETSLLLLLAEQTGHGYSLSEQLKDFGFGDVNASTLYRIMRKMDERGWVNSSWEKGEKGPERRVYSITDDGRAALDEWIEVFKQRRSNIEMLLSKYQEMQK